MTRDYSQFLPKSATAKPDTISPLHALGWQPFFAQQTDIDTLAVTPPVRITAVHRSGMPAIGDGIEVTVPPSIAATVGDWVLWRSEQPTECTVLDRKSLIKRRAAGHDRSEQLIAANIDTAFVVTSCNQDFNVARLERYIALALEADASPVIILTKSDLSTDVDDYLNQARAISDLVPVVVLDARGDEPKDKLAPWCSSGQTVAFLGSSGVGKSTLTNALSGRIAADTQSIREDDGKGRHTTTARELHFIAGGCAVLDTPGMRELQLTDAAAGVGELFADLTELGTQCKFRDCAHETEPGCAVTAAIAAGEIDAARLTRWKKLVAEDAFNSADLATRRAKDKAFGKKVRAIVKGGKK